MPFTLWFGFSLLLKVFPSSVPLQLVVITLTMLFYCYYEKTLFIILILLSQLEFIDLLKHFEGMKAVTNDDDENVYTIQLVTEAANFLCRKQ